MNHQDEAAASRCQCSSQTTAPLIYLTESLAFHTYFHRSRRLHLEISSNRI